MDDFPFALKILRTNRKKTSSIQLSNGEVLVRVPKFLSNRCIQDLILERRNWIIRKLKEESQIRKYQPLAYRDGELLSYLGKMYPLKILQGNKATIAFKDQEFRATITETDPEPQYTVKKILTFWYRENAKYYFNNNTLRLAKVVGVVPNSITIKNYKARWGSCSVQGDISFNWKLILAPKNIIDYVIIHELCHILEHNHSPKYWKHVTKFMPNWKDCRDWLKKNHLDM